jgi:hypothetical protein
MNQEACFTLQIKDGEPHIAFSYRGFQSRHATTWQMIQRVRQRFGPLPDAEIVIDTSDGYLSIGGPTFVISKFETSEGGILYPDFSFFAWLESECPHEQAGSHVWTRARRDLIANYSSFSDKESSLFWRGAPTSVYRRQSIDAISQQMRDDPPVRNDIEVLHWGRTGHRNAGGQSAEGCVTLKEWCQHKYLANIMGNTGLYIS